MKKRRILLPILLLSTFILGGCNFGKKSSENNDQTTYGVEIKNKAELEGEWYVGGTRNLSLALTPEANALEALGAGELTVTSSDPAVVTVTGLGLKGMKAGKATVEVAYHGAKASVDATILDGSAIGRYGAAHAGDANDPLDNEDALLVAKHAKYEGESYYVRGEVHHFYHSPAERTDGVVSYFLTPAAGSSEMFEVYKTLKEDGSKLTDDDIWKSGIATAYGTFTSYNGQYETTSAKFVSCTGGVKPNPRANVNKTFAEALADAKAAYDGDNTYDYYVFGAYVTKKSGSNYFLTATQGEAITDEKANTIEIYNATADGLEAKLLKDAQITVRMVVKNYHGQAENLFALSADDVTVDAAGTAWPTADEPATQNVTLAEFINSTAPDKTVKFHFSAKIKAFKTGATKDKYGNMTLTDDTNDLTVYGSTATASALAWNGADTYVFTNPQDFMTNPTTNAMNVGDTVEVNFIRYVYSSKVQGQGIIIGHTPAAPIDPEGITLNPNTAFDLAQGANRTIQATLSPAGATGTVLWSVSPTGQGVTISDSGVVSAAIDATEDTYTITATVQDSSPVISASVTCTVVDGSGGGGGASSYTLDFTAKTANHNSYSDEWTYGDATLAGAANNNGGWAFVKFGPKSATISGAGYLGTYAKLNTALDFAVSTVTINLVGKCYNQDSEKANVHIEAYSDSAFTSKVAETTSQYVPAITTNEGTDTMTFTFAAPAANRYYKVVFDITNTTTYNGVAAVASIVFAAA